MRLLALLPILILLPLPSVSAGETPWQEVAPGVSVRLISSGTVASNGKSLLAIEISMPDTTKTYWRVPGQAGLPTEIDLSGSQGILAYRQLWPYPQRHDQDGILDYVYFGNTVLPIELSVDDPDGKIELRATMGVCSEICVPAQADFSMPLSDTAPDRPNGLRIRQALAEVPVVWTAEPSPLGDVGWTPSRDALVVEVDPDAVDFESLIASTESGLPLFGAPQKSPQADLVLLPILGRSDIAALDDLDVQLTFMTDMGAFEVDRIVGQAGLGPEQ